MYVNFIFTLFLILCIEMYKEHDLRGCDRITDACKHVLQQSHPQLKILQYFSRVMSDDFERDYNRTHNMSDELRLRDFSFSRRY